MTDIKTPDEALALADKNGFITWEAEIRLEEIIQADTYEFTSMLAEQLVGMENREMVYNINYEIIGYTSSTVKLKVSGNVNLLKRVAAVTPGPEAL